MAGGIGTHRDDTGYIVLTPEAAETLADRLVTRFHQVQQKLKGGTLLDAQGSPGPNPVTANTWGGKAVIKYNPSVADTNAGIRQEATLLVWQSPDGLPHYVTIDIGRLANGVGGPNNDNQFRSDASIGAAGGGTFPLGADPANLTARFSYRACAQVLIGTPGTMQDYFYVDINRGQRFTALASYVAITAKMDQPPQSTVDTYVSGSMGVYATLGMGVAPSVSPVVFTQYVDRGSTEPTEATRFNRIIPPRANRLLGLMTSATTAITAQLHFQDNAGNPVFNTELTIGGANLPSFVPILDIPQDCYNVIVSVNADQTVNYNWRLVYQLSV